VVVVSTSEREENNFDSRLMSAMGMFRQLTGELTTKGVYAPSTRWHAAMIHQRPTGKWCTIALDPASPDLLFDLSTQ
jgi:hypothetical protein